VDVQLGQSTRLKLLRNEPITGSSSFGPYHLYPVVNEQGIEEAFFAPEELHTVIKDRGLKSGDEFILSRVQNGKPGSTKLEISIIGKSEMPEGRTDHLKETMQVCLQDAASLVESVKQLALRAEDARSIALTLFIARTKANGFN
jgi:hypothetical protein